MQMDLTGIGGRGTRLYHLFQGKPTSLLRSFGTGTLPETVLRNVGTQLQLLESLLYFSRETSLKIVALYWFIAWRKHRSVCLEGGVLT